MVSFDNVKIIKEIARGMNGTVYLAKDNKNNKYAYKVQQIFKEEIKKDLSSRVWRENDFANTFGKKYPQHFMKLYDFKIDEACKHKQSWDGFGFKLKDLPMNQQKYYTKLFASPYCSVKLWSYVDMTLKDLLKSWDKFKPKVFYNLLIQIIYVIYLVNKEGYFHNDYHPGNIGVIKTKQKYITIFGKKIKTYGYIIQAIDYELNLHKKYKLKSWEKVKLKNDNDVYSVLYVLLWNFNDLQKKYKNIKEYKPFEVPKVEGEMLKCHLEGLELSKENEDFLLRILYRLLFWEKYERDVLKVDTPIPPFLLVPMNVILYMIKNIYEPEKIIKYLIKEMDD
jgi:hypothetical protein